MEEGKNKRIESKPIHSINALLEILEPQQDRLDQFLVFRGQTSAFGVEGEQLNPSIFRYPAYDSADIEKEIYTDFYNLIRIHASTALDIGNAWELLCYAQHIGVPTRLLDWTINPLIAAYFAVEDGYQDVQKLQDGIIFTLNVTAFTAGPAATSDSPSAKGHKRLGYRGVILDDLPKNLGFLKYLGGLDKKSHRSTVAGVQIIQPPVIDTRIQAQSALFSVDLNETSRPHDSVMGDELSRFTIPKECKGTIKTQLYRMGIHAGSIYPDVNGLGRYLTDRRDREHWVTTSTTTNCGQQR